MDSDVLSETGETGAIVAKGRAGGAVAAERRGRAGLRRAGLRRALAISLALHLLAAGGLLWRSSQPAAKAHGSALELDVVAVDGAPGGDPFLIFEDLPTRRTQSALAQGPDLVEVSLSHLPPGIDPPATSPAASSPNNGGHHDAARQTAGTPGGPAAGVTTHFFGVPVRAARIVYLIDASSSMGPSGALAAARCELWASLERLPAGTRFQILVYNSRPRPLVPRFPDWLTVTPEHLELTQRALAALEAEGKTVHGPALQRALALVPEVIFLLTDAGDLTPADVEAATRRNRGRTHVHVIELNPGNAGADPSLRSLAESNGGTYQAVRLADSR